MAKPSLPLIVKWRDLAEEGWFYSDIAKGSPGYTPSQIRHYCLGNSGAKAPGPIQKLRRWSDNPWLQGERSPHALLDEKQVPKSWTTGMTRRATGVTPPDTGPSF